MYTCIRAKMIYELLPERGKSPGPRPLLGPNVVYLSSDLLRHNRA